VTEAETLLEDASFRCVIADKAYDSDALRETIRRRGGRACIPSRRGTRTRAYDRTLYKLRNVVERFVHRLKHFRAVATRYDKTDPNYLGLILLAAAFIVV
jgi:transposase